MPVTQYFRARTLIIALVVIAGGLAFVVTRAMTHAPRRVAGCVPNDRMVARDARESIDTIGRLRDHTQEVTEVLRDRSGIVIWTEDTNRLALHDGGRVGFDCSGSIRLVWLDGG